MTLSNEERELLVGHHIRKADETAENVEFLIENNRFSLAISQIYYGIYYMLSALAIKNEFRTSKHLQLIGWFNKTYVKEGVVDRTYGRLIQKAYENRVKGDYDVFSEFSEENAKQAFEEMKEIIDEIKKLLL